jgi:hypothetical protein
MRGSNDSAKYAELYPAYFVVSTKASNLHVVLCDVFKALVWRALLPGHWTVSLDAGASKAKQRRKGKDPLRVGESSKPSDGPQQR